VALVDVRARRAEKAQNGDGVDGPAATGFVAAAITDHPLFF
jgi:hypothetical protein